MNKMEKLRIKLRTCFYVLKQSAKNIIKNLFMVFASLAVVFAVLLIVGVLSSISLNLQTIIDQFGNRAEIQINFNYFISDETAEEYLNVIKSDYRVENAVFISKEENFERLMSYFEENRDFFETYRDSERLQFASIEVYLKEFADGDSFLTEAKGLDGVESVKDIVKTMRMLEAVRFVVRAFTIVMIIAMVLLSILLIFNTVKLTIFARRNEIEIMKFVGATDIYIISPFIIEGVFTGFVGAILAYITVKSLYGIAFSGLREIAASANIELLSFKEACGVWMPLTFIAFGIISGFVASILAAKKYMKV